MLGLRIALSVAKGVIDEIGGLLSKLARRSTYSENLADSRAVISDIDSYDLLDKATILLTPTATSDARVHSVKTYTGDELVANGTFDTDSDWNKNTGWSISGGIATYDGTGGTSAMAQADVIEVGKTYKLTIEVISNEGTGANTIYLGGTILNSSHLSVGTHTFYGATSNTSVSLNIYGRSGEVFQIDNVSVIDVSSDFAFDRASSATRINSSGLVQDMQSITDPELVLNGNFEELGDELVTNGTFDTDSDWTADYGESQSSIVISNNQLSFTSTVAYGFAKQEINVISGKTYKLLVDIDSFIGNMRIFSASGNDAKIISSTGLIEFYFVPDANTTLIGFSANNDVGASVVVNSISVQQVDPNDRWSLGTGWSIEDGKLVGDGTNTSFSSAQQSNLTVSGNTYQITLTVEAASGAIELKGAGVYTRVDSLGVGTHTLTFVADATYFRFLAHAGATATIDNISVKDITFSEEVDLARINYDSNGENGHILLEPTSTNILEYSEDFSQWILQDSASVSTESYTSPSGDNTAKLIDLSANSNARLVENFGNNSTTYTLSFYLKKHQDDSDGTFPIGYYNGTDYIKTYVNLTNAWQRFSITFTNPSSGALGYGLTRSGTTSDETLTRCYAWGAQLEELPYATSYIPTYGSTVTRATETLTGSGNSTLINSTEGVLYAEIAALANDGTSRRISLSNGSISNRVSLEIDETANRIRVHINASLITYDASDLTSFNKIAVKYKVNDYALWLNGVEVATSSSSEQPSGMNVLSFTNPTEAQDFYGKVKALAVFNEALSDDELELLTGVTNYGSFGELASANGYTII
jgi:hypothetical protein